MTSYWYSTNGLSHRRLSNSHLTVLDQAYEQHARIQIYDDEMFGENVIAIANPYQGTMTAGDLHFGLYRQPPMWHMSNMSLDTLIFMDTEALNSGHKEENNAAIQSDGKPKYNFMIQKKMVSLEENCICCIIS
ncbi:uncharacterized protein BX663DRAFT_524943 [Cokeromyces recurvatus]|uniref:uncharacterized protein n=1 Tax=Cokeromyces recurvatus TaxID=90255 RepID=UPI00221F368F|nr:uncharacterized protein BX663DRAFT_524943 [Cokeromyces recurvatus]KAI7898490.1 hypothetical protein BX663DRAFT_524943 [Cokeromyces recurvatus]